MIEQVPGAKPPEGDAEEEDLEMSEEDLEKAREAQERDQERYPDPDRMTSEQRKALQDELKSLSPEGVKKELKDLAGIEILDESDNGEEDLPKAA